MTRSVVITGLGPISGLGIGIESTWQGAVDGRSAVGPCRAFDASPFPCPYVAEVPAAFKPRDYVPRSYRKATKIMARDIELAVAAADLAARDARLTTRATAAAGDDESSYPPHRMGAQIGAGLIAADLDELTAALDKARDEAGDFDIRKWGREGMHELTPLWLLKYLPNMLACHVTIVHDAQGPSNTITCTESSAGLSLGEAMHVIGRGGADACFCGGLESRLNLMSMMRQTFSERYLSLDPGSSSAPAAAVRPFDADAGGCVPGEGGAIVILESEETFLKRKASQPDARAYARVAGFAASQTVNPATRNRTPDPEGDAIAAAARRAISKAGIAPEAVDLIVPFGCAVPDYDRAEAAALRRVFGSALAGIRVCSSKAMVGLVGAGSGGIDLSLAAQAVFEQKLPAVINCDEPLEGLDAAAGPAREAGIRNALVLSTGLGGQNTACVLQHIET